MYSVQENIVRSTFKVFLWFGVLIVFAVWGMLFGISIPLAMALMVGLAYFVLVIYRPFWTTQAIIFTLMFGPFLNLPFTQDGFQLSLVFLFTAFLAWTMKSMLVKDPNLFITPVTRMQHVLIIGFLVSIVLSTANSMNLAASAAQIKRMIYIVILYFFIVLSFEPDRKRLERIFIVIIAAAFFIGIIGLIEMVANVPIYVLLNGKSLFGSELPSATIKVTEAGRILGPLGSPEYHCIRMITFLAISLYFTWSQSRWKKIFIGGVAFLAIVNIFGTAYRGGMIALAFSIFVYFVFAEYRHKIVKFAGAVVILVLTALMLYVAAPSLNIERLVKIEGESGSTVNMRYYNTIIGLNMFADHPIIGQGPEGFIVRYNHYAHSIFPAARQEKIKAHNTYIQVLSEYGLLGFSFFLSILLYSAFKLVNIIRNTAGEIRYLALSILMALSGYLVMLGGSNLFLDFNLWMLIALAWVIERMPMEPVAEAV